jgi:predicted enzyme related to lactoylglutathione lyase
VGNANLQAAGKGEDLMRIKFTSVFVDDQESALKFYTDVLGFEKKQDFPVGEYKWLTVVSPEEPDGTELLLEPSDNPAARSFKDSLYEQGIAAAAFAVDHIQGEYARLKQLGVDFKMEPTDMGTATVALFDDTCGNLIQIYQAS